MSPRSAIPVLLFATLLRAGTLVTTDGESYTGDIKKTDDGWSVTDARGVTTVVVAKRVKTLELSGPSTKPGRAEAGLASLRRSVESLDDLGKVIRQYDVFIERTQDVAVATEAKADQAEWQARLDQGLVKSGKQWVTPQQRDDRIRKLRQVAEAIRLLLKDHRNREADTAINGLLTEDPQNASGLYLRGVRAIDRGEFGEAKKAFQGVNETLKGHAPTLNNLAIIAARQKQWGAGCAALEQAIDAAPQVQALLDTAAEYLNAVPPEQRRGSAARKLYKTFTAQDAVMQKNLAARGLYRWGSTWIDQAARDKIDAAVKEQQKKIDDLQKQFADTKQQVTSIERQISDNERAMSDIELHNYTRGADGEVIKLPLPRAWYDLSANNQRLKEDRDAANQKLGGFQTDAVAARNAMPQPTFSGKLTTIDEDGVPLAVLPDDPPPGQPAKPATTEPSSVIRIGPPDGR